MLKMPEMPADMPPIWGVYFAWPTPMPPWPRPQELGGSADHGAHGHRAGSFRHHGRPGRRHVQRPGAQGRGVKAETEPEPGGGAVERRRLGRTGHESSVAILGGAACWAATPEEAGRWLGAALDRGVNHLDIAPQYGAAESVVGPHLAAHRRDRLRRRQDAAGQPRRGPGPVRQHPPPAATPTSSTSTRPTPSPRWRSWTAARLRSSGSCGYATRGTPDSPASPVTTWRCRGRLPRGAAPLRSRHRHVPRLPGAVGTARVPRDGRGAAWRSAQQRDIGVMAIKAVAHRPWHRRPLSMATPAAGGRWATSWYEPAATDEDIDRGVHFALSTPGVHGFCTPGDIGLLPRVLDFGGAVRAAVGRRAQAARSTPWRARSSSSPCPR